MGSELSPVVIAAALGGFLLVGLALFLALGRRRTRDEDSDPKGEMLGLERPQRVERPARSADRGEERVPERPRAGALAPSEPLTPVPTSESVAFTGDPETARLHEKARRRARTVVREIMMYNEEKLEKGRREGNIMKYLGREIEMSRKLYQASIELSEADSSKYFDESLLGILAGGDARLLREE